MVVQVAAAAAAGVARAGASAAVKATGAAVKTGTRAAGGAVKTAERTTRRSRGGLMKSGQAGVVNDLRSSKETKQATENAIRGSSNITRSRRTPGESDRSISRPRRSRASGALNATRSARGLMRATPGGLARQATERALGNTTRRMGEASGKRFLQRQMMKQAIRSKTVGDSKRMAPWRFGIVLAIMITKDLTDIGFDLTGIGVVITVITSIIAIFILAAYYAMERVIPTPKKVLLWVSAFVLDILPIPFIGFLITGFTASVSITYLAETNPKWKKIFGSKSKLLNSFK